MKATFLKKKDFYRSSCSCSCCFTCSCSCASCGACSEEESCYSYHSGCSCSCSCSCSCCSSCCGISIKEEQIDLATVDSAFGAGGMEVGHELLDGGMMKYRIEDADESCVKGCPSEWRDVARVSRDLGILGLPMHLGCRGV
jgi:hypothetical protein